MKLNFKMFERSLDCTLYNLFNFLCLEDILSPVLIISRQLPIFLGPFYKSLHGFQCALIIFFHIYSYLIGVVGESDS